MLFTDLANFLLEIVYSLSLVCVFKVEISDFTFDICVDVVYQVDQGILFFAFFRPCTVLPPHSTISSRTGLRVTTTFT